jgi:PAS domain S-box-containing protein
VTALPELADILCAFLEKAADGIFVVDQERRILAASATACRLLGVTSVELVGRHVFDFIPDASTGHLERWARIQRGEAVRSEVLLARANGERFATELVTTPNVLPGIHVTVFRDISERRKREVLSERYELLARHTNDIVLFIDETGKIVEANEAAERAYGYDHDELVSLEVKALRAPHTLGDFSDQLERAFTSGVLFETEHRRKDGTTFPVEVGSRSAVIGGQRMLLSIIRDITERRLIQARLVQADRLGAFGMIAAGVAHEINNPLAYALNNLEMIARRVPQLEARFRAAGTVEAADEMALIEQMLETAREGMNRVRHITRDLKTFSRGDSEELEGVDVRQILESAVNLARGDIRHRAELVRDYGEVRPLRANASRLGQVFLNLLVNAAQSIPEGRTRSAEIRVATRMEDDAVVIEVSDNGVGIPPTLVDRIFEPFITTKPEGTGLGLYIARSTVREHGGDIQVLARPEGGTTVRVVLPASVSLPPHAPRSSDPGLEPDPSWRVLIVDDEAELAATLRDVLSDVRHVAIATNGEDAFALFDAAAAAAPYDVVLCDVMMPGMSGKDVYDRVAARWPELARRFIFMTGGATTAMLQEFLRTTDVPCLAKPFTTEELERALRRTVVASSLGPK